MCKLYFLPDTILLDCQLPGGQLLSNHLCSSCPWYVQIQLPLSSPLPLTVSTVNGRATSALLPGRRLLQQYLIGRVAHLKLQQMTQELQYEDIFGTRTAHAYTIEYQKRRIPHMHLVLWIKAAQSFLTTERVDERCLCRTFAPGAHTHTDAGYRRELHVTLSLVLVL